MHRKPDFSLSLAMTFKNLFALLAVAALCGGEGVLAQGTVVDSSAPAAPDSAGGKALEEVVVTGVSGPTRLQNALSQYRIITRAQLDAQGAVTLAEALPTQLNISLGSDAVLGTGLSLQGLGAKSVKILVDGLPVNGREGGAVDIGQLNLAHVERIEIVQGPLSVVYGSDALGGVVNLITRKSRGSGWHGGGAFNWESVGRYNAEASAAKQWASGHSASLVGGRNFFGGWGQVDSAAPYRRHLFKPKEQYFANGAYAWSRKDGGLRISAASDYLRETVTARGAAYVNPYAAYSFDEYYRTLRSLNRLSAEGILGKKGRWTVQNGYAHYRRIRERTRKDLVSLEEVLTTAAGDQDTSRFDDLNLRSSFSHPLGRVRLDGGYDVTLQQGSSGKLDSAHSTFRQEDYAVYAGAALPLASGRLTLGGGLRAAYNSVYSAPVIPSFQILYKPSDSLQLRLSYARGFRAPTLKELHLQFVDQNHEITGNPDLKAERGVHLQASVSKQWSAGAAGINAVVTGFYNDVRDLITLVNPTPDPQSLVRSYGNLARVQNVIGNAQVEIRRAPLTLMVGYGLTQVFPQSGLTRAFQMHEANANGQVYWPQTRLTLTAFYKFTGAARQLVSEADGAAVYGAELSSFHHLDLSVQRTFWRRLQLIGGVKNVLDVRTLAADGAGGGVHGSGGGGTAFLPRRAFTTLRMTL